MLHPVMTSAARKRIAAPIWLAVAAAALSFTASCTKITTRSGEGLGCSRDEDENPRSVCDPSSNLKCVTTRTVMPHSGPIIDVWECRRPCDPAAPVCAFADDVCCPGRTVDGMMLSVCTPAVSCAALPDNDDGGTPVRRDGGADARDASVGDAARDASGANDALGTADGPVDAPVAPVDAVESTDAAQDVTP